MQNAKEIQQELDDLGIKLPKTKDVYALPVNYLNHLTENIVTEISVLQLTEGFGKTSVYVAPEKYFENFEVEIPTKQVPTNIGKQHNLKTNLQQFGIAASVAALLAIGYMTNIKVANPTPVNSDIFANISEAEITNYQQEMEFEVSPMAELELTQQLQTADEAQILQYLNAEAIEIEG